MVENGIKPVYVFDGKPPALKSGEVRWLTLRCARRRPPAVPHANPVLWSCPILL